MSDTTDNLVIAQCWQSDTFLQRIRLRFINAAISVTTESTSTTNHDARKAFAGALFANQVDLQMLGMAVVSNPTIRGEVLADPTMPGGAATDSDIDFQIASVFFGIATSRNW